MSLSLQVSVHLMGMSTPEEVRADVALLKAALGLAASPAPAPAGADNSTHASTSTVISDNMDALAASSRSAAAAAAEVAGDKEEGEGAAQEGGQSREAAVLKQVVQELEPYQGTTWPVGLTGNRK